MDMTSLNISLPKALKEYVAEQVSAGAYSTPSEYVRELIREDQKRRAQKKIEWALLEGISSGPVVEINADYWTQKRRELREKHKPARVAG
ncbi:MAG: type II toxin-antitoxin system ParD family antitoxin [Terriglobia bacterium]